MLLACLLACLLLRQGLTMSFWLACNSLCKPVGTWTHSGPYGPCSGVQELKVCATTQGSASFIYLLTHSRWIKKMAASWVLSRTPLLSHWTRTACLLDAVYVSHNLENPATTLLDHLVSLREWTPAYCTRSLRGFSPCLWTHISLICTLSLSFCAPFHLLKAVLDLRTVLLRKSRQASFQGAQNSPRAGFAQGLLPACWTLFRLRHGLGGFPQHSCCLSFILNLKPPLLAPFPFFPNKVLYLFEILLAHVPWRTRSNTLCRWNDPNNITVAATGIQPESP